MSPPTTTTLSCTTTSESDPISLRPSQPHPQRKKSELTALLFDLTPPNTTEWSFCFGPESMWRRSVSECVLLSVVHTSRYAFSKNNQPSMVPIPNQNAVIGKATQMSQNDITRLNSLYNC